MKPPPPPPIFLPAPDGRSREELRDLVDHLERELVETQELAELWERRFRVAEQDGYYRGLIANIATTVRYPRSWGGDD